MSISLVVLLAASLFDTLPVDRNGDAHARTWTIHGDDWIAGVQAFPTADPQRLVVRSPVALLPGPGRGGYLSDWSPVVHQSVDGQVSGRSAAGARLLTGERAYGPGAVSVLDAVSGAPLFAVPSAEFSTAGQATWPWLSAAGDAAVFTVADGSGPTAPYGGIAALDGIVLWEEGSAGLRLLLTSGAVHGASASLDVLVVRHSDGRVVAYDRSGAVLHQLCAPHLLPQGCAYRGVSPDGRYVAVLDESVLPHRRGLLDLTTGTEDALPPRGNGSSWVAFDQQGGRMLYSRAAAHGYEMVVRYLDDGREIVLDTGPWPASYRPIGFVAEHYALMGDWDTTFVDTRVISADGFDARDPLAP